MGEVSFREDTLSWRVIRFFVLVQIAGVVIVLGLSRFGLFFPALTISFLTFLGFVALLLWLYSRYIDLPLIREKRELERLRRKFRSAAQAEGHILQAAIKERELLSQAEKDEIYSALSNLQAAYIANGLIAASLSEAVIPGIGKELKERLAGYGIKSAAQVTDAEQVSGFPGFGERERLALMEWQRSVLEKLESTKPKALPDVRLETIKQKYQPLHDRNDIAERKARASKQILEHELLSFHSRLQQLTSLTFFNYLSRSLASRGIVAAGIALLLILSQVVSSVSAMAATASSILAAIPTATPLPSQTATLTLTFTPTVTYTPTPTQTPTLSSTPVATFTAPATATPLVVVQPSNTPYIPVSGVETQDNCDPSYPGVCIPPAPPDLDCAEVPYRRFQVLPPDPHHFDRDTDGIGCES